MNASLLESLVCPACGSTHFDHRVFDGSPRDIREGVVWCAAGHWFPIQHRVLEFLPPQLQYMQDRAAFERTHAAALEALNLPTPPAPAVTDQADIELVYVQQHHFDWYAGDDRYNAYSRMPFWRVVDQRTFDVWNARIRAEQNPDEPQKLLLDVGCAQGRSAALAAQSGVRIVGFDISKGMVRQAYESFARLSPGEPAHDFIVADGRRFPFKAGVFDYALVYGVLHHLPDPAAACRETARVLKPSGTYFGSENNVSVFRGVFDALQRMRPIWHEEAGAVSLIGSADLARWFAGTGLTIRTSATVLVPPHLVNLLGVRLGGFLLGAVDAVFGSLPFLRHQGGLILIEGRKAWAVDFVSSSSGVNPERRLPGPSAPRSTDT